MTDQPEKKSGYISETEFLVRDYECDLQGVVNNANYQHYLEHARHQFLISRGISFSQLHDEGIDLIVTKVEIDYKFPLRSRDRFVVKTSIHREGYIRLAFIQNIYRLPDEKLIVKAKVVGASTQNGKPSRHGKIFELLNLK
jgi:acyl-CoA thioester hydrolase